MPRQKMAKAVNSYTVLYKLDDSGWWVATVKEIRGCHTQGRTIEQARNRIREALGLFIDNYESVDLKDSVFLPAKVRCLLTSVEKTRKRAEEEATRLRDSTIEAVQVLTQEIGVSVRDAGEILGLSHQRVHQLMNAKAQKKA